MVFVLTFACVLIFVCLLVVQLRWARRFANLLRSEPEAADGESLPRALVLLCLRGADPFLDRTLKALLVQTHEHFHLRLVIDSETDPAWQVVEPFLEESRDPRVQVRVLKQRLTTCSLKNSALLQETADLDDDYEAIVQVDADAVPYPDWLRDLLSPLKNPQIGATSGLRWYAPTGASTAGLIRFFWGCAAMIQMVQFKMLWGGSLAIRRDVIDKTSLRSIWARSLSDDLTLSTALREAGLKEQHVPAVLVNEEGIDLKGCFQFIRRQLIFVRLYHSAWRPVSLFVAMGAIGLLVAAVALVCSLTVGELWQAPAIIASVTLYGMGFRWLMLWVDDRVRSRVKSQGETIPPREGWHALPLPMTMLMYTACYLSALRLKQIQWRGVTYKFTRTGAAQVVNDAPYEERLLPAEASVL